MKIGPIEGAQEDKWYDKCLVESSCCKKHKPTYEEGKCENNNEYLKRKVVRINVAMGKSLKLLIKKIKIGTKVYCEWETKRGIVVRKVKRE